MNTGSTHILHVVSDITTWFDGAVFAWLIISGLLRYRTDRRRASFWFISMSSVFLIVVVLGHFVTVDVVGTYEGWRLWAFKSLLALLVLFPFCLFRFMRSFARARPAVDVAASAMTLAVVVWSMALPSIPSGNARHGEFITVYLIAFFIHWAVLSIASATYFWREGKRQRGIARRRLNLLALASIAMTAALLVSSFSGHGTVGNSVSIASAIIGAIAVIFFDFGFVPPRFLRTLWRARISDEYQNAFTSFLNAGSVEEVSSILLPLATQMVGGSGAAIIDRHGHVVASSGFDDAAAQLIARRTLSPTLPDDDLVKVEFRDGYLVIQTTPATPFFASDELRLLDSIANMAMLAMRRAEFIAREQENNMRLRQLDQLKNEFVAMVAHDIRSPMTVIAGFADTIHDQWDRLPDEQKLEFLRLISRNTKSLAAFVEDVLQVARIESGELRYECRPFDLRAVVDRTVTELQGLHHNLRFTVRALDQLPLAYGDEERNWQILTNLVSNAIKFSPPESAEIEVRLVANRAENTIQVSVGDHGIGIDAEDMSRIFQKFSRIGNNRREVKGTGLGLYIVKSMVEAQGGRIWVRSTVGEGSTFSYEIPIAEAIVDEEVGA